jgi:YfiH family protein
MTAHARDLPKPVVAAALAGSDGIRHGFFDRRGGVSTGIHASLNCGLGSNDDPDHVRENRRRVAAALGVAPGGLLTAYLFHRATEIAVTAPWPDDARPRADGLATDRPGLALGVLTADCGPVLFADPQARVIGAAHAGWRGAFSGVLENTIAAMEKLGARRERIVAVLGPAISAPNYEVGPEFVEQLIGADSENQRYFTPSGREGHALFDLNTYSLDRLAKAGVETDHVALCTYAEEELLFSYRRASHRGEKDYGRQISAIVLEEG